MSKQILFFSSIIPFKESGWVDEYKF